MSFAREGVRLQWQVAAIFESALIASTSCVSPSLPQLPPLSVMVSGPNQRTKYNNFQLFYQMSPSSQ